MKKKLLALFSLTLALVLFLGACSPSNGGNGEVKDTLVVGMGGDAVSLDPHATNDQPSSRVSRQIYDTLILQTEDLDLVPALAVEWEQVDDTTFEFKLREGVLFHNGEELKASDVKFTLERALESTFIGHIVGAINGVEVVDDYTVRISTARPFAPLLTHLAHPATAILNEKAVTEGGEDYGQNPVGTGAFKFVSWTTGDNIVLERFDDFWGDNALVKQVTFRAIPDNSVRTIQLETGELDIAYDIQPSDVTRVENDPNLVLLRDANLSTTYVGFNADKEPFDDVRVRQAINYAIDMEAVVNTVYAGVGSPAKGPLGPNVFGSNQDLVAYGQDIEKAKELLAEAGFPDGFETTLWTNENQQRIDIATIVQEQLDAVGITVTVEIVEWGQYLQDTAEGRHDMFILGWTTVTADADYGLYALFHSAQVGNAGNRTFYRNAEVDRLLDLGRSTIDQDDRLAAYEEAQQIIRDEAPWIFTWTGENLAGLRKNVTGFRQHPAGHHKLDKVTFTE
jgi:peptide/nickel transport system substrate-binding protein